MLFVVFGHINLFCIYGNDQISICKISYYTSILQLTLFMFLSGFVTSSKPLEYKAAIKQLKVKFKKILIPFFVVGGIWAYVACNNNIVGFLFNSPKLGYWYLSVLFLYYTIHILYQLTVCHFRKNFFTDIAFGGVFF